MPHSYRTCHSCPSHASHSRQFPYGCHTTHATHTTVSELHSDEPRQTCSSWHSCYVLPVLMPCSSCCCAAHLQSYHRIFGADHFQEHGFSWAHVHKAATPLMSHTCRSPRALQGMLCHSCYACNSCLLPRHSPSAALPRPQGCRCRGPPAAAACEWRSGQQLGGTQGLLTGQPSGAGPHAATGCAAAAQTWTTTRVGGMKAQYVVQVHVKSQVAQQLQMRGQQRESGE